VSEFYALNYVLQPNPPKQTACVLSQRRSPPPAPENPIDQRDPPVPAIPLVDLTEENTVPYLDPDSDIEIIEQEHPALTDNAAHSNDDTTPLEPLDPDAEYHQNLTRIFVNLDEYARTVLYNIPPL